MRQSAGVYSIKWRYQMAGRTPAEIYWGSEVARKAA